MKLYQKIAILLSSINNKTILNHDIIEEKENELLEIVKNYFPSGSGFDTGAKIDIEKSNSKKIIVFTVEFHHMNENGFYDGWTYHEIKIIPNLAYDFTIRISGKNKNEIKEYIDDVFSDLLYKEI